jgi:sec-independent protein translocase protein TatA
MKRELECPLRIAAVSRISAIHLRSMFVVLTSPWKEKRMGEGLLQPQHLLLILIIAIFVFGPKKLPELGRGLGESIRGFKKALHEGAEESDGDTAKKE